MFEENQLVIRQRTGIKYRVLSYAEPDLDGREVILVKSGEKGWEILLQVYADQMVAWDE